MGLLHALALEQGCYKGTREGIPRPYRIGHIDLRSRLERHPAVRTEHIRTVDATGEYQHLEFIPLHDFVALVLKIHQLERGFVSVARHLAKSQELGHRDNFLIIEFQYVASYQGTFYDFL